MAQTLLASFSAGSMSLPKIEIYEGTMPASIGDVISGTLLASFDLSSSVGVESNGVITFDQMQPDTSPPASGTAEWARLLDRDGTEKAYMTVSETPGSDITLSTTAISAGEPVALTSGTISVGA